MLAYCWIPTKQSRFKVEPKAFEIDPESRNIVREVEYKIANIEENEIKIVNTIKNLLFECGDFNQSELEKEVKSLRINLGMGEKKFRTILKKHAGIAWEAKRGENNALIFSKLEKNIENNEMKSLQKLPNQLNMGFSNICNDINEDTKSAKVAKLKKYTR